MAWQGGGAAEKVPWQAGGAAQRGMLIVVPQAGERRGKATGEPVGRAGPWEGGGEGRAGGEEVVKWRKTRVTQATVAAGTAPAGRDVFLLACSHIGRVVL